ncbi:MAG: DMT family transporter [Chloroflexi bacterium]|nr:DMT family transporter [Chloroflexota bacterium]
MRQLDRVTTYLMLAGTAGLWGGSAIAVKLALPDLPPVTIAAARFATGAVTLVLLLRWRGELSLPPARQIPIMLVLGLLGGLGFTGLYTYALQYTGAGEGSLIAALSPIVTVLVAAATIGERITGQKLVGTMLSFAGVAALVGFGPVTGTGEHRLFGDLVMIAAALSWGSYSVVARVAMRETPMLHVSAYSVLVGAVGLAVVAAFEPQRVSDPLAIRWQTWLCVLYMGVPATALGYLWWNEGVRRIGASRAAAFSNLSPVSSVVGGYLMLGERFAPGQIVGAALVIAGLALAATAGSPVRGSAASAGWWRG